MDSNEIRLKFLKFFENRGHKIIPSASLIPENDPSALFNIAGMQPLMPYLLGEKHPDGKRLVNIQKCLRTVDLDEVGDNVHLTFFEMMGNWSLGDYFKEDAIKWSYEFLTSKKEGLGLDVKRLYVTIFGGSDDIPRDTESVEIWKSLGVPEGRIYFKSSKSNWWSAGPNSPAGPSTEMFYDLTGKLGDVNQEQFEKAEDEQKVVEIWNDVFMVYRQEGGKVVGELPNKNVDTGAGLERITTVVQNKKSIYNTDVFSEVVNLIERNSESYEEKSARIVADHIRTSVFLIADGVIPSNTERGYVLRRILRRAIRYADKLKIKQGLIGLGLVNLIINKYRNDYPNLVDREGTIKDQILGEEKKFKDTLEHGLKEFERGTDAFTLFTTYGFPIELTLELAKEKGKSIDLEDFNKKMAEHQKLSQTASAGMFKGGLADGGEETKKLHTATHLLNAALRQVFGNHIMQKGSNITAERLRFDFTHPQKMTEEEKKKVEEIVNDKIAEKLPVSFREIPKAEAERLAIHSFNEKYGEVVKVYSIGDEQSGYFSREFCGGPHVNNTGDLGHFRILKEEAVAQGIRRIKAILE